MSQRGARFVWCIAVDFPDGKEFVVRGTCEGTIGFEEKGSNGFGYDNLFIVNKYDKTFAELFKPYLGDGTKLIIVGGVMDKQAAEDALKYTDLVAAGRAQIIDANFARKVVTGEGSIISEITDEEELQQKFTPGLREVFDKETKRPNFAKKAFGELDYDKALKY